MSSKLSKNTHHKEKYIVCKYVKEHLFVYTFCPVDDAKVETKKIPTQNKSKLGMRLGICLQFLGMLLFFFL